MKKRNNEPILRWAREHRDVMNANDARYSAKLHAAVLDRYGRSCAGPGPHSANGRLLVVRADGSPIRPGSPGGRPLWRMLRDAGWPDGYVTMCQACIGRARRHACPLYDNGGIGQAS